MNMQDVKTGAPAVAGSLFLDSRNFPPCPVCGGGKWSGIYAGPVRAGSFGKTEVGQVARCETCGIERLNESLCLKSDDYRTEVYRDQLEQGHDIAKFQAGHDELARFTLETVWPLSLRGQTVADVGCGGGSLLDHIRGVCGEAIAIDPAEGFSKSLRQRGYNYFPSAEVAARKYGGKVDVAFAIQVIEHVADPRSFLAGIYNLLKPGGILVLSTPNRDDILMDLLPGDFPAFFYRTQHRWAFSAAALSYCAEAAGFCVQETRYVHRYGMANALLWLRDRKPSGRAHLPPLDREADSLWRTWLEASGRSDNLYLVLTRT